MQSKSTARQPRTAQRPYPRVDSGAAPQAPGRAGAREEPHEVRRIGALGAPAASAATLQRCAFVDSRTAPHIARSLRQPPPVRAHARPPPAAALQAPRHCSPADSAPSLTSVLLLSAFLHSRARIGDRRGVLYGLGAAGAWLGARAVAPAGAGCRWRCACAAGRLRWRLPPPSGVRMALQPDALRACRARLGATSRCSALTAAAAHAAPAARCCAARRRRFAGNVGSVLGAAASASAHRAAASAFDAACTRVHNGRRHPSSSLAAAAVSGPQCADGVRSAGRAARARAARAPRCAVPQPHVLTQPNAAARALHFPAASRVSAARRCSIAPCCLERGSRCCSCCAIRAACSPQRCIARSARRGGACDAAPV